MPEPVPNAELLRSLGRLVRGLSALFWGLPITLLVCFYVVKGEGMKAFGIGPPLLTTGLLAFGLWQLGDFQKQERVWQTALDRARLLSLVNLFLSPFLFWWNKLPANGFLFMMVLLLTFSALLFLASLNLVLRRLGAMLPDEAHQYTAPRSESRVTPRVIGAERPTGPTSVDPSGERVPRTVTVTLPRPRAASATCARSVSLRVSAQPPPRAVQRV
jgi:hypothetical protein